MSLDDMTKHEYLDVFKLTRKELLPYEKRDNTWISVTVEMNLNLMTYERSLYTLFDLLSDVGGLSGILFTMFGAVITLWNFNSLNNLLVSDLFNFKTPSAHETVTGRKKAGVEGIKKSRMPYCREQLICCLPRKCTACCRGRKERAM